jgi:hypothetical protein
MKRRTKNSPVASSFPVAEVEPLLLRKRRTRREEEEEARAPIRVRRRVLRAVRRVGTRWRRLDEDEGGIFHEERVLAARKAVAAAAVKTAAVKRRSEV